METDAFGAQTGKLDNFASSELRNDFNTISNNDVFGASDRVQPRQVATGVTRGTWRINSPDGSYVTIGEVPDGNGEFGIAFFDTNGNLISKDLGSADYQYDDSGNQISINGKLPDGDYGLQFSDGTVTTTIKAGSIVQNDGTHDRLFMGNE